MFNDHASPRVPSPIGRREALRRLAQVSVALAASACTPARYVLHLYPEDLDRSDAGDRILSAFARTVIPGAPADEASLFRALKDSALPFHRYAGFFAADLDERAQRQFRRGFAQLGSEHRVAVVEGGLHADRTTCRLYEGAIFLTQIAYFSGIYDAERGCPLIDFDGCYRFRGLEATTFPDPDRFLARSVSLDGNPA
jgi:hypothetical protein